MVQTITIVVLAVVTFVLLVMMFHFRTRCKQYEVLIKTLDVALTSKLASPQNKENGKKGGKK